MLKDYFIISLLFFFVTCGRSIETIKAFINTTSCISELDDSYLSIGLDTGVAYHHWDKGKFDFR